MTGRTAGILPSERLSQQPTGDSFEVAVPELTAGGHHLLEDRARSRRFALKQIAVPQPDAERGARQAEIRLVEPLHRLRELRCPRLKLAEPDQSVPLGRLCHGGVDRARSQLERLLTAAYARLRVATLDVRPSRPPPAHHFYPPVVHRLPVLEGPTAAVEAPLPLAQVDEGDAEPPQRSARPPHVASPFERRQFALTGLHRCPNVARPRIDVRAAA